MLGGDLSDQGVKVWVGERTWGRGQWGHSLTLIQLVLIGSFGGVSSHQCCFFRNPCFQVGTQGGVFILDLLQILPTKSKRARRQKLEEKRGHTAPEVTTHLTQAPSDAKCHPGVAGGVRSSAVRLM